MRPDFLRILQLKQYVITHWMQEQISESSYFLLSWTLKRFAKAQNNVALCVCLRFSFRSIKPTSVVSHWLQRKALARKHKVTTWGHCKAIDSRQIGEGSQHLKSDRYSGKVSIVFFSLLYLPTLTRGQCKHQHWAADAHRKILRNTPSGRRSGKEHL